MSLETLLEAVRTLGMPVAVAVFLLFHFVGINKSLTKHNQQLAKELSDLRLELQRISQAMIEGEKLLSQNERLVAGIEESRRESLTLVSQLVEAYRSPLSNVG